MKFERDYDVVRYTLRKEFDGLLSLSRSGDKQAQENLSWLLYRCHNDVKLPWEQLGDEKWIAELAGKCFYPALYVYLRADIYTVKSWSEDFVDEDTGKVVSVERDEIESLKPLFAVPQDIQEALVQKYFDGVYANRERLCLAEEIIRIKDEMELCGVYADRLPQYIEMLTGIVKGKKRNSILEDLAAGKIDILVGTHAVIEDNVRFARLGMAVVDEQHRFGVAQRAKLWQKSTNPPHVLVMTATPIPRTLAMTLYGDLDVSVIDELPPGRKPVMTQHVYDAQLPQLYESIRMTFRLRQTGFTIVHQEDSSLQ